MKKIEVNPLLETRENDRYWTFCIGSGHAALALRADYQKQLERVHKELGIQRIRFHGLFNDDMKVVTSFKDLMSLPGAKDVQTINFHQIGVVFDAILEIGMKPFVEIGFMPNALAKNKRKVFYYKGNVSLPKKEKEWIELIESFMKYLVNRYGIEEVETWFFEVWNEPDLKGFFFTGSQKEYFRLYEITAKAIKKIIKKARVGGPATSQNRWLKEMQEYCAQNNVPLDYLSTHHYPGDDIGLPIFTVHNLKKLLFTVKKNKGCRVQDVFHKMMYNEKKLALIKKDSLYKQTRQAREEAGSIPLYYTEWNANPTCTAPTHDECSSATFIIKHILDNQYLMEGCSLWCFSDIFEENTFFPEPFSGCFGLMNIHGIAKPSYWAFYILNLLGDKRVILPITNEDVEIAVFKNNKVLQIILYNQNFVDNEYKEDIELDIPNIYSKNARVLRINKETTNPKQLWIDKGCPEYLSKEEVKDIMDKSKPMWETIEQVNSKYQLSIQSNEIIYIEIKEA